ncbi:MAG TPA: methylmalonyl-CoA mutase, partial [Bacteroidetes bacterium]|nr:methylmalonyl-CoA mutase [Bacteroidota bacterium]
MARDDDLKKIQAAKRAWEEGTLERALEKRPERRASFDTVSGVQIQRLYTPLDLKDFDYLRDLGFPGEYPFTRGIQPTMYRGRLWTMRQYAGFGTAEDSNRRLRYLLDQGQTGLSIAFDLPTQAGYDSDHPLASGEVGKVGVAIDSLDDMRRLLEGIPLDRVSTSMTINAPATVLLAMYLAVAEEQGVAHEKLRGTVQNDVLKEYISRGQYIFPIEPTLRLTVDLIEFCHENLPRWNPISISGYHMREAGATAWQEMAFTIANAITYVQACVDRGIPVDAFAPRISFFFNAFTNLLEEVAKFRAGRRFWARTMRERFGAENPRSLAMRYHVQTGGVTLTAQQPLNNIVRVTLQALAAVLGGAQSLHTNSYDEALCLPSEQAATVALRTQQILAEESGVADVVDPLGGAYAVEALTNEMEERIAAAVQEIDKMGGMVEAIRNGFVRRQIQESAYRYQKQIESGERVYVGVNRYVDDKEPEVELLKVDPRVAELQRERLAKLRAQRDPARWRRALENLREVSRSDE